MTVKELYEKFEAHFPKALSAEWDNDGLMCTPDSSAPVRRVLFTLDVTEDAVSYATENGYDVILSHHPLIFRPLSALDGEDAVTRKCIDLFKGGISVFSFHTRADAKAGSINDILAGLFLLSDPAPFSADAIGRVGTLPAPMALADFATAVKEKLGAPHLLYGDAHRPVSRVAVVGGGGKDAIADAIASGADTLLTGELGYHALMEAEGLGINLVEAGHFFTEAPILSHFAKLLRDFLPSAEYGFYNCYRIVSI